jgi:hypothetical protein
MSVSVMTLVWKSYPGAGSELLLMLALGDRADDEGGSLFPSVKMLAQKTRLSERQVQRILRNMESEGWLFVVGNHAGGAPGMSRKYQLNVKKLIKLASEVDAIRAAETGDISCIETGDILSGRVTPVSQTGDIQGIDGCHPCHPIHQLSISDTSNIKKTSKKDLAVLPDWVDPVVFDAFCEMRKRLKKPLTDFAANLLIKNLDELRRKGHDPTAVLNQSILNSWQGVFAIKQGFNDANSNRHSDHHASARPDTSAAGRVRENVRRELESLG